MIWSIIDMGSVVLLALVGGILAIKPPKDPTPKVLATWISFIAVLAIVSVTAKYQQDAVLEKKLTGGDSYCFIRIGPLPPGQSLASYPAQITNQTGRVPSATFGVYRTDEKGGWKLYWGWSAHAPCLKTTINLPFELPLGKYRIDFMGSNRDWHQYLTLQIQDGALIQTSRIVADDGSVIRPETTNTINLGGK